MVFVKPWNKHPANALIPDLDVTLQKWEDFRMTVAVPLFSGVATGYLAWLAEDRNMIR